MITYDILILIHPKDFVKFPYCYESIVKNVSGYKDIYCVSPVPLKHKIDGVIYYLDEQVVDFDTSKLRGNIRERKGWYLMQMIKFFQEVTSDTYLQIDGDIYLNKPLEVFKNGKPNFFLGKDQNHTPYFRLMKELFDLDRIYDYSFINEMMLFKRDVINDIVRRYAGDKYRFFNMLIEKLNQYNKKSGFSEYEFYGQYVTKYFPGTYNYKHMKVKQFGKRSGKNRSRYWSDQEIVEHIKANQDYDKIDMHTWK